MHLPFLPNRISTAERAFVARQLATMLTSGLPIDRAVAILANQIGNRYLVTVFKQIETDLEAGLAFSATIVKHPKVFNRVFVNVIIAGEAVGKVAEVLQEMAGRLEKEQEFSAKIKGALYYPIFILVAMTVIGIILMVKVVPEFRSVFEEADVTLPLMTQLLISISEFLAHQWWLALIFFGLIVTVIRLYLKTEKGKLMLDYLAIRFPTGLGKDLYMARFSRTLGLLSSSGTPIIEALSITAEVINNRHYSRVLETARDEVARGIPLSVPLSKSAIFPLIVPQMVLVGEQTGRFDQVLGSLAEYYEEETSTKLKALSSLFEPVMIVIVGLGVAFMVFSIFIPLYTIARF